VETGGRRRTSSSQHALGLQLDRALSVNALPLCSATKPSPSGMHALAHQPVNALPLCSATKPSPRGMHALAQQPDLSTALMWHRDQDDDIGARGRAPQPWRMQQDSLTLPLPAAN